MAASLGSVGAKLLAWTRPAFGCCCQLSLKSIGVGPAKSCICGLARAPGTPNWVSDGPRARITRFFGVEPPMMKPPIITLSPVSTGPRVEMFVRRGTSAGGTACAVSVTCGAAPKVPLPGWLAATVQVPEVITVSDVPLTEQMDGVRLLN